MRMRFCLATAALLAVSLGTSTLEAQAKSAEPKTCRLGTQWAVNLNRQVQFDEREFTTTEPYEVRINQRESPGSSHIVWRDCVLPAGTVVVVSGGGMWVKKCGNDVFGIPYSLPAGLPGPAGPMGPMGPPGPMGPQGLAGEAKKARETHRFCSSWLGCRIPLVIVAAGIGYGAYRCISDLCRIQNTNTNINNNPGMAPAGFQLRVSLF